MTEIDTMTTEEAKTILQDLIDGSISLSVETIDRALEIVAEHRVDRIDTEKTFVRKAERAVALGWPAVELESARNISAEARLDVASIDYLIAATKKTLGTTVGAYAFFSSSAS